MKNPMALGLVLLGSLAMVIATFLPLNESGSYRRIEDNTLIQHGGWMLIALAIWIAAAGYYVDRGTQQAALVIVPCVLAGLLVAYLGVTEGRKPSTRWALTASPTPPGPERPQPWASGSIWLA